MFSLNSLRMAMPIYRNDDTLTSYNPFFGENLQRGLNGAGAACTFAKLEKPENIQMK